MISRLNIALLSAATVICIGLYTVKHDAQQAERDVQALSAEIRKERETLRVLQAEWALRTEPQRLERLTANHLQMAPIEAHQIITLSDLPLPVAFEPLAPPQARIRLTTHGSEAGAVPVPVLAALDQGAQPPESSAPLALTVLPRPRPARVRVSVSGDY